MVFIPGCTWMPTSFSFQTVFFRTEQHVLLRRHCVPPSPFATHGELTVREIYHKQSRRVPGALEGCVAGHGRWSIGLKMGAGRCPSYPTSISLLTSDYFISSHYQPSYLNWSVKHSLFPRLLSARLLWLLSLFLLSSRELFRTQYINVTRFNPSLIAPGLSLHTDYAISYLLNYFTSQLLTEQI